MSIAGGMGAEAVSSIIKDGEVSHLRALDLKRITQREHKE